MTVRRGVATAAVVVVILLAAWWLLRPARATVSANVRPDDSDSLRDEAPELAHREGDCAARPQQ